MVWTLAYSSSSVTMDLRSNIDQPSNTNSLGSFWSKLSSSAALHPWHGAAEGPVSEACSLVLVLPEVTPVSERSSNQNGKMYAELHHSELNKLNMNAASDLGTNCSENQVTVSLIGYIIQ
jgi:hypothetical protein